MKVSLSAFYAFRRGVTYRKTKRQAELDERVQTYFYFHKRRCGARRIAAEFATGRAAVRAAMRRENLTAITPRKFKQRTTDSNHDSGISPNLLKIANEPRRAGEVIVGDIIYIRLADGSFCSLAVFRDKLTSLAARANASHTDAAPNRASNNGNQAKPENTALNTLKVNDKRSEKVNDF